MGLKFTDCAGWDISWRTCCSSWFFNIPLAEFTGLLWVIILHEYKSLTRKPRSGWDRMMLQYTVIAGLIHAHHLVQISNFATGKSPASPWLNFFHALQLVSYQGLQLFHQLFTAQRTNYFTQRFQILILQSKELYSIALLSSLCAPWPARAFWHCFASWTVVSW